MENTINLTLFTMLHAGAGEQPILDFLSVIAAELTPYLTILCMAIFWFSTDRHGKRILLEGAAVVILGLLCNQLITLVYYHPRPYMMDLCKPLIPHGPETSFPSDHATLLFGAALGILGHSGWSGRGVLLLGIALAGSWGRVYTGIHFPFDIAGSFIVALICKLIVDLLRNQLISLFDRIISLVDKVETFTIRKEKPRKEGSR